MKTLLVLYFLLCSSSAWSQSAKTFYVSKVGSDTNAGSLINPYLTIQRAANVASSGDTILVGRGVYDERVYASRPGILFLAQESVTNRGTFYIRTDNTTISGFDMTCDGAHTFLKTAVFIEWTGVTNARIVNNRIHDTPTIHPRGVINFDAVSGTNLTSSCIISNNRIYNIGGPAVRVQGHGHLISENWISNTYGADCFNVSGDHHVVRGNFVTQVGSGIINVWGAGNPRFNGPYLDFMLRRQSTSPHYSVWTNTYGYHIVSSSENWTKLGWSNVVNVVDANHMHVYASARYLDSQWTMHDPVMVTPFIGGIGNITHPDFVESIGPMVYPQPPLWGRGAHDILFENNLIINCPGGSTVSIGSSFTNIPGPSYEWTFRNNIWADVEVTGTISLPYCHFINNTFYKCSTTLGSPITFSNYHTNYYDTRGMALYSEVKRNAFVGCGKNWGTGWYGVTATGQWATNAYPGFPFDTILTNCDYNYVGELDGSPKFQRPGTAYPSPDRYAFYEPHGINGGDPKFVNPGAGDFRIAVGSVLNSAFGRIGADPDNNNTLDSTLLKMSPDDLRALVRRLYDIATNEGSITSDRIFKEITSP